VSTNRLHFADAIDLGSRSETLRYAYGPFNSTLTTSVNQRDGIVRTGLTYKFW
jgi:hypothetical protein